MYKIVVTHRSNIAPNLDIYQHKTKSDAMIHGKQLLQSLDHGSIYVTHETKAPEVYILVGCKSYGKLMKYNDGKMVIA